MHIRQIWLVLASVISTAFVPTTIAAQEPLHELFGSLPEARDFQISPDGGAVAAIAHQGDDNILAIYDLADSSKNAFVKLAYGDVRDIVWASDDWVIVDISATEDVNPSGVRGKYEIFRFLTVSRDGKKSGQLLSKGGFNSFGYSGRLLSTLPDDPDYVLIEFLHIVYRAHLRNGTVKVVETGLTKGNAGAADLRISTPIETEYYVVGENGQVKIRSDYYDNNDERLFLYREGTKGRFKEFATFDEGDGEGSALVVVGMMDGVPVVKSRGNRDEIGLYTMSLEDGSLKELATQQNHDIEVTIKDPYNDTIIGYGFTDDLDRQVFLSSAFAGLQEQLKPLFPEENVRVTSWSRDRKKFVLEVEKPGDPASYLLLDLNQGKTISLGKSYPAIGPEMTGEVVKYDYTSSDGLLIPGYLTYPVSGTKKALPLVVMPHGGPASRDSMTFDWWAQYFAAKGYAVYQPNFRGSSGYGFDFESASYGQRGKKMQSDIYEGVEKLVSDGIADPERMCIVGASYGGYAALASAAFNPQMFDCAVSVAGIGDVRDHIGWVSGRTQSSRSESVEYLAMSIGSLFSDTNYLDSISPENAAKNFRAPVLLIHGEEDTVVPVAQSKEMAAALAKAGKPHELILLNGEDHWLSTASTRKQMLKESGRFVDQHIGQ